MMSEGDAFAAEEDHDSEPDDREELQFDQAEYATPAPAGPACGVCKRPIDDAYYEINGKIVCAQCRQQIEAAFRGGSRLARALKALILGSLAAVAGAAIYYGIIRATGYNIGLVAIVVGFMVGGAVRKGSGNRGGRFYQVLALFLAYIAIALMHVPMLVEGMRQAAHLPQKNKQAPAKVNREAKGPVASEVAKVDGAPQATAPKQRTTDKGKTEAPVVVAKEPARPGPVVPPGGPGGAEKQAPVPDSKQDGGAVAGQNQPAVPVEQKPSAEPVKLGLLALVVLPVVLIVLLATLPVVAAFADPLSGLIYCFTLWEAWRLNKAAQLVFTGPFRVSAGDANATTTEDADDGG
jgi:hypothetical protein